MNTLIVSISLGLRYLAESNCSTRFCRPLPNRSAKVPLLNCDAKVLLFFGTAKTFVCFFTNKPVFSPFMWMFQGFSYVCNTIVTCVL